MKTTTLKVMAIDSDTRFLEAYPYYFSTYREYSLAGIYAEIDQLEKTKVEAQHFVDYRELAVQPYALGRTNVPPLLLIAFVLLSARLLLQQTWLRELA